MHSGTLDTENGSFAGGWILHVLNKVLDFSNLEETSKHRLVERGGVVEVPTLGVSAYSASRRSNSRKRLRILSPHRTKQSSLKCCPNPKNSG